MRSPIAFGTLIVGIGVALYTVLPLQQGGDDMPRKHGPQPDGPAEYLAWRNLSLVDESGTIPVDGLMRAKAHVEFMRANAPVAPIAGISRGSWTSIGPGNVGGRVRSVLIDPANADNILIGSVAGGIWRTTNGGAAWAPVDDFMANLAVSTFVRTPGAPSVIYAGTGEGFYNGDGIRGAGIFKSTNGGTSWAQLPSTSTAPAVGQSAADYHYVNRLAMSSDSSALLAATRTGIYWSTDEEPGANFARATMVGGGAISVGNGITDVDFHPSDPLRAVAGTFAGTALYSLDGGVTWTLATGLPGGDHFRRVETAFAPSNAAIVYASVDLDGGSLYKSIDGGQTFTEVLDGATNSQNPLASQGWYDNLLAVSPVDENFVLWGGVDLFRSITGGTAFTKFSAWENQSLTGATSAHADHHIAVPHPNFNGTSNRTFFFGNDGGIYRADDVTTVGSNAQMTDGWVELNNNFGVTQFYGGAGHPGTGRITGGTQDNGTLLYNPAVASASENWTRPFGGDGGYSAYDPTDANYFYGEYVYLTLHRNITGGASSSAYIYGGLSDATLASQTEFIAAFVLDPNNPNRLLGAAQRLWRSNNVKAGTPSWEIIKNTLGLNDKISAIAVAPGNSNIVYVGHNSGRVYKTTHGDEDAANVLESWTTVDDNAGVSPLPSRRITRIAVDPNNNDIVYVTLGGFSGDNVYKSINAGASWVDITGPSGGATALPEVPVRDLDVHPTNSDWIYAGTEVGIFSSEDGGATWSLPHDGPSNAPVDELFFLGTNLVAVTHGRGMFSTPTVGNQPAFITSPTPGSTLPGSTVDFTWSPGTGADQYWLSVGTSGVGSSNIWYQDQGTSTTRQVTGLPTNGSTVYVRLWTRFEGEWVSNDYTYTASTFVRAAITLPTPGSTLSSSLVSFVWSAGTGALQYWLDVGTAGVGSSNIYRQDQGTATNRTVGIPANGAAINVRLWTRFASGWQFNDYTYTAATLACSAASVETPRPHTFLYEQNAFFIWNGGSGNTQFWLQAGTTPGGSNVFNQNMGTSLGGNVGGIVTSAPFYLRLWSYCNSTWSSRDQPYNPSTVRARLLFPAPFHILGGSTIDFTWVAGTGSTQYWIFVGNALGAADIWNENMGTALNKTVTGIPVDGRKIYLRLWSYAGGWYYTDYSFTTFGDQRARLSFPLEYSMLNGAETSFVASAGSSSTQYWLYVGTSLGAQDLWNENRGTTPSGNVTGLPTDHRALYARYWSLVAGSWVYNDYQFRAYDGGTAKARMSFPASGSTLVGSTTTFTWTTGSGATQYWLYVGTAGVGSFDLWNRSEGTATSRTVSGIPTDGSTIYVRLWTLNGGVWTYNDYDYKAAP